MEILPVWHEETRVKTYETDFQKQWKPASFFQAMQEAASHHAEHLGVGYREMLLADQMWILSRVRLRFHAFPALGELVKIETWPKGVQQRLFFMRDFWLQNEAGLRLADASTAWLLVSPSTRRILSPASLKGVVPDNGGRAAIDDLVDRIAPPEGLQERLVVKAGYSAIDLVGHVTNSRYIDWIADAFTLEEHAAHRLAELQINYTSEVKPGESVSLAIGPDQTDRHLWWVQGTHCDSGARAFEAWMRFTY
jgi:medium-chain acyl-[acyl-carrier-protein] hydrolase